MKRLLLTSTALVLSGSAFAADLPARMPVKAPIAVATSSTWTGCYIGGHAGAGWDRTTFSDPGNVTGIPTIGPAGSSVDTGSRAGALGGVQAGCDYQFATNWVVGLAGDFSWANIDSQGTDPFFAGKDGGPIPLEAKTDRLATFTGRLGYAWGQYLLYGKGGAAWAHTDYTIRNLTQFNGSLCSSNNTFVGCVPTASETRLGWTAGAGFEWAFAPNWSALIEYDHYGFESDSLTFADPNATNSPTGPLNVKQNIDVVKVGLNYRFGWLRP
jgi:outer membrane immunogenic protein